ncbi:MAG: hypothetical protein AAFZ15_19405 [Bacteroidota bacterium]
MASDKDSREEPLDKQKLLLASKYVIGLLSVLERLLASKDTDNQ